MPRIQDHMGGFTFTGEHREAYPGEYFVSSSEGSVWLQDAARNAGGRSHWRIVVSVGSSDPLKLEDQHAMPLYEV